MKILVVTNMFPTLERPSHGSFVGSQVQSIQEAGHEVDVIHIRGEISKFEYLKAFASVRRAVRSGSYDVIHAHYGLSAFPCLPVRRVPLVISYCGSDIFGHTHADGRPKAGSAALAWCQRQAGRFADKVIVKSREMATRLPAGVQARTEVIPNGVSFDRFRPGDKAGARDALGLSPDVFYVLFPYAPDRPRKNFALLETAIETLRGEGCRIEALVMHERPPEELAAAMRAADGMALTSFWEGSPNAIKEAMASNLPLVAVDVGDVRWLVGKAEGCFVTSLEQEGFTRGLRDLHAFGGRPSTGRAEIEHLRLEKVADRVVGLYASAQK